MPDPDRLVQTLRRAAQHNRHTPHRRGHLVELRDADEVLVAGDLHGNLENFRQLLQRADLGKHPRRHFVLQELVHGPFTYPDGGDRSHQLFDVVAALKCQYPLQVHLLPGNHELAQFTHRKVLKNDQEQNALFLQGVQTAYRERTPDVLAAYHELFLSLPLALRTPNRVFISHSLPSAQKLDRFDPTMLTRPEVPEDEFLPGGSLYALCWGRDTDLGHVENFLHRVDADLLISGHIPCEEGYAAPNERQLILDCLGCPAGYCLFPADRPLTHQELLACAQLL
jgi:hypothetical protein